MTTSLATATAAGDLESIEDLSPLIIGGGHSSQERQHRHARPVLWKGTLAKVAVVAVPNSNAAVLSLQRTDSDTAGRGYRLAIAALR